MSNNLLLTGMARGAVVLLDLPRAVEPEPERIRQSMPHALKITLMSLLLLSSFGLAACNTISGMGQDVEAAGDAVSDTAEETKEQM